MEVKPVADADAMFDAFVNGRLPKDAWTHEAHLITCWVTLRDRSPVDALAFLREAIQTHNCGIGIRNDEASGYHETLTRFYIGAVANSGATSLEQLLADPSCDRTAALHHWDKETLFSTAARLGWVEPNLLALPWLPPSDDSLA